MKSIYITEFQVQKKAVLIKDDTNSNVIESVNVILQQVQIFYDKYIDNNNYVELDEVNIKDSRFDFTSEGENFYAFKIDRGPTWTGNPLARSRLVTEDNGKTFFTAPKSHTIFGAYYFYSENMWESTREARNWFHVLSDVGGLYSIVMAVFYLLASNINNTKWVSKQVRNFFLKVEMTPTGPRFRKIDLTVSNMMKINKQGKVYKEYYSKGETML